MSIMSQMFPGFRKARRDAFKSHAISTLTYQSRATKQPTSIELYGLLRKAKARNECADVTGMLVFKDARFFQWLEGPSDGLDAIWNSIQNDPRHKEIELLSRDSAQQRLFSQWDMRVTCPDDAFGLVRDPPTPQARLPIKLVGQAAKLAIDQRTEALQDGIEEVLHMGFDIVSVYSALVEPVAHRLGDLWMDDECSDAEIGVALGCLQAAVRRVSDLHASSILNVTPRHILVMPPPGEAHMLGIVLAGDLYREAGWLVEVEFPSSDEEVAAIAKAQWFDAVTVNLSDVFTRIDRIDALTNTVRTLRRNSINPNIVIMVGGRTFAEKPDLAALVGADAGYANVAYAVAKTKACFEGRETATTVN
jgi:methanogenic corrinoid protein MtbC1